MAITERELRELVGEKRASPRAPRKGAGTELPALPKGKVSVAAPSRVLARDWRLTLVALLVPIVILASLSVLFVQQRKVQDLAAESAQLRMDLAQLQAQNAFYKKAYELTLDDIKALSATYGGEERYERLAQELRERELAIAQASPSQPSRTHEVRNPGAWQAQVERGVIASSCLAASQPVDTVDDEVLIAVSSSSLEGVAQGILSLYIDANFIADVPVGSSQVSVVLAPGPHAVDIVSEGGGVRLDQVLFDTVPIAFEGIVVDQGSEWATFDCMDAGPGAESEVPAGFRFLVEKS